MVDLLEDAEFVYDYIKTKSTKTTMNVPPTQASVEAHLEGLQFEMQNRGQKSCVVKIEPKIQNLQV